MHDLISKIKFRFAFTVSMILMIISFQSLYAQSNGKNPNDDQLTNNRLIGTWKLINFADTDSLGNWTYPFGKNPKGFVTYTRTHIFNINMSSESQLRVSRKESETYSIVLDEFLWKHSFGYFGDYVVDFKRSVVTHKVKGGTIPWFIGTDQPRPFILKGDTLIIGDNKTWKRVLVKAD